MCAMLHYTHTSLLLHACGLCIGIPTCLIKWHLSHHQKVILVY